MRRMPIRTSSGSALRRSSLAPSAAGSFARLEPISLPQCPMEEGSSKRFGVLKGGGGRSCGRQWRGLGKCGNGSDRMRRHHEGEGFGVGTAPLGELESENKSLSQSFFSLGRMHVVTPRFMPWENMTRPKKDGELGFRGVPSFNVAMLARKPGEF